MTNIDVSLPHDIAERHRAWLVRLIVSRTGSEALVDDILQEISLAVVRSKRAPKQVEEVPPWLCKIAIRQCALALRKAWRQRRLKAGISSNACRSISRLDDPVYWLLDRERSGLVRAALKEMDVEKRSLLIWKYVDGMTYAQLATRLGVATHVAEYRVITARKTLRASLTERGLGEEDLT